MQKAVVVYILYVHKIFTKSVYVKYQIFSSTYTKNAYTYMHTKNATSQKVYILIYTFRQYQ